MPFAESTGNGSEGAVAGVLIPAHNEAEYIDRCLAAVLGSRGLKGAVEIVVAANACSDDTVVLAQRHAPAAAARGWSLRVIECAQPGKLNALALGEAALGTPVTIYLDADVIVSPDLLADLVVVLDRPEPRYASGRPHVIAPASAVSRAYARFWRDLPFVTSDVPGFGIFAVNRNGRARWGEFPDIISDDTFVRLNFAPTERIMVDSGYTWPLVRGLSNLVRVRRRQNEGVTEIARLYPALLSNDAVRRPGSLDLLRRFLRDPMAFGTYALVAFLTRFPARKEGTRWVRGR